jgi:pimeloyl-ACP methyl ester carboxylesterase
MHLVVGHGQPVVFVHGNGSNHETWDDVIAAMAGRATCVAYDLRGHSPTAPPLREPTMAGFVQDLEELRASLGLEAFHLVGQSLGAFIAAAYAIAHPTRVSRLALLAAPAGRTDADRASLAALLARVKREGVMPVMPDLVRNWYTASFRQAHPEAVSRRLAQIATIDERVFIEAYELYANIEIQPWLAEIRCPTLVLTGQFAQGCDEAVARAMAGRIRKARLVTLDGLMNGLLTEAPERVADELASFFGLGEVTPAA